MSILDTTTRRQNRASSSRRPSAPTLKLDRETAAALVAALDLAAEHQARQQGPVAAKRADEVLAPFGFVRRANVFAALTQVSRTDVGPTMVPQWLGESLAKARYKRVTGVAVTHKDLTAPDVEGYEQTTRPTAGDHASGAAVDSGDVQWTAWGPEPAYSWMSADSFDRTKYDFDELEWLLSFTAAESELYERWIDDHVFSTILTPLTAVAASTSLGNVGKEWGALIDGIEATLPTAVPTFALVESTMAAAMLKEAPADIIDLISEMVGGPFAVRADRSGTLASRQVLVGSSLGVDLHELPGAPVRVEAYNIGAGNIDIGVYGYAYPKLHASSYYSLIQAAS